MDPASGLLWSPAHFTWMDTRYPMGSPREGYPVEIQALWIRLLRLLERLCAPSDGEPWSVTATRAQGSLGAFWLEDQGWFADVLLAGEGVAAKEATPADHLRPNQLFLVSLGLVTGDRARRTVAACARHLLVPGGLRSLAPLPVSVALPIPAPGGGLLNDPLHPYQGRYEGDEDTRRKPAYHNGTAWVWLLPLLCEALDLAWNGDPAARATARAWLGSVVPLLDSGCLGQLPEILDGDAPHAPRGCDAQAWSASEALRVWEMLKGSS
jgi:glycogen debranching enzyme